MANLRNSDLSASSITVTVPSRVKFFCLAVPDEITEPDNCQFRIISTNKVLPSGEKYSLDAVPRKSNSFGGIPSKDIISLICK